MSSADQNEKVLTWKDRIDTAKKTGHFTNGDQLASATYIADPLNEKYHLYRNPKFHQIHEWMKENGIVSLGIRFMRAVRNNKVILAERLYGRIMDLPDLPKELLTDNNTQQLGEQS